MKLHDALGSPTGRAYQQQGRYHYVVKFAYGGYVVNRVTLNDPFSLATMIFHVKIGNFSALDGFLHDITHLNPNGWEEDEFVEITSPEESKLFQEETKELDDLLRG